MKDRFCLDQQRNILFINFTDLKIDSREQVKEMEEIVCGFYQKQGRRIYAIVNYEGAEISPEIVDYYGERIKKLYEQYGIATVRYSSNGFTRSVLRYLGAAKDLESNIFTTREEAIRAIEEIDRRSRANRFSVWSLLHPGRSAIGRLLPLWCLALAAIPAASFMVDGPPSIIALAILAATMAATFGVLYFMVINPLRRMESFARRLVVGGPLESLEINARDEIGRLALALDETGKQLRREFERLSGLYHISLLIGAGAEVRRVSELLTGKVARLLQAEKCLILLCDESGASISAQSPGFGVTDEQLCKLRAPIEKTSVAAWVVKSGEPYLTNDASGDELINREASSLLAVEQLLAVPLRTGERTFGVLEVINKPGGFLEEDRRLATIFASQAAQLLMNARHLEKERRLAQDLIQSERLAAIGELTAGVAHEVRNPLCGITTTLSALDRKLEHDDRVRPFLDVVNAEVNQLNYLMEQLLEHSSPIRLSADATNIEELIDEAIVECMPLAESAQVMIQRDLVSGVRHQRLDRRKMRQVFVNLLVNAIQHSRPGGRVRIAVAETPAGELPSLRRELQIEVGDQGEGIPPENLGRIFDPFFTTRPRGTGLGLAITRKTIHDHGGVIRASSVLGQGAVFTVTLPLDADNE